MYLRFLSGLALAAAVRAAAPRPGALRPLRSGVTLLLLDGDLGFLFALLGLGFAFGALALLLGLVGVTLAFPLARDELLGPFEERLFLLLGGLRRDLLLRLAVRPVEVDELDDRHLGAVTLTPSELHDSGVAAGALLEARRDLLEELLDSRRLGNGLQGETARVETAPLSEGDHLLDERPEVFRLRQRRLDPLVGDEGRKLVPKERLAMRRRPAELATRSIVLHGFLSDPRRPETRASCSRRGPCRAGCP